MPTSADATLPRRACRSLFLSDFHLGARSCQPGPILSFLRSVVAEKIYLIGDIFDIWHGARIVWGPQHNAIVAELERAGREGAEIVYLTGNHDAPLRRPGARAPLAHAVLGEAVMHEAADGRRYLVLHGDQCDPRLLRIHMMTRLGSRADASARRLDAALRAWRGEPRNGRSMIERAIGQVGGLMQLGDRFEHRLTALAELAGTDGVICGHSHKPALRDHGGMLYANTGDWVDSLTALIEDFDGALRLIETAPQDLPEPRARPLGEPVPVPAYGLPASLMETRP